MKMILVMLIVLNGVVSSYRLPDSMVNRMTIEEEVIEEDEIMEETDEEDWSSYVIILVVILLMLNLVRISDHDRYY